MNWLDQADNGDQDVEVLVQAGQPKAGYREVYRAPWCDPEVYSLLHVEEEEDEVKTSILRGDVEVAKISINVQDVLANSINLVRSFEGEGCLCVKLGRAGTLDDE